MDPIYNRYVIDDELRRILEREILYNLTNRRSNEYIKDRVREIIQDYDKKEKEKESEKELEKEKEKKSKPSTRKTKPKSKSRSKTKRKEKNKKKKPVKK